MDWFTPFLPALFGGILIGLSALLLLLALGRIAGISGILANLLFGKDKKDFSWRLVFVAGLILGAAIFQNIAPQALPFRESPSTYIIAIAGFLVGYALDEVFDTRPIFMLACALLGFIGGIQKVIRVTQRLDHYEPEKKDD